MRIGLDLLSEVAGRSSGTETYLAGFLKALKIVNDGRHEFFLFVNPGNEKLYRDIGSSFQHVLFPVSNRLRAARVLSQLTLIPLHARRLRLDVVNFLGTTGAFGVGCATVQHVKTLHHIDYGSQIDRVRATFRRALMGPSARAADIVIANSASTRDGIVEHLRVNPDHIAIVPEAVDQQVFLPRSANDTYERTLAKYGIVTPYILFVSSLWPYKNAHGLIKAFGILVQRLQTELRLVIVGGLTSGRYNAELRELVRQLGLVDRVHFVDHVSSRNDVRDFYVGAEVFVYPSYAETFGLTLLEAMACGTPVVASNRTSIPEVAGNAAVLVSPDNPQALSDAIWEVLRNQGLREKLRASGLLRAGQFTWERTAAETVRAYEKAVLGTRAGLGER